ncbi:MAG: helix-turn-helix transcriptional regulator, partial [Planctomycetes bacterium]|nr:helix-turn-helix transcriptional regulator [Planctomycetota bacterium]
MGKIEALMKTEIVRLAKKEIRPLVTPLQRKVRSLVKQVRTLAAANQRLIRLTAKLEDSRLEQIGHLSAPEIELQGVRMSAGLIKKLRLSLGLTQQQLALLIGVSAAAVQSWEQNVAKPGAENKAALAALRKLGRRDVAKLLAEKGVSKPGRKPRAGKAIKKSPQPN